MINLINTQEIKIKFATLISRLYTDSKLSLDLITNRLITCEIFDFLERNDIDYFLHKSFEEICREDLNCNYNFTCDISSSLYWSGLMYMTIAINKKIPLKQVALLCPLKEMVSYFEIYHEMNDEQFIEFFVNEIYKRSILRLVRKQANMTVNELSLCSGIASYTLKYYEKSNENLFKASFENISTLINVLKCSTSLMYQKSQFINYSNLIFDDEELYRQLCQSLDCFYNNETINYEFDGLIIKRIYILNNKKKEQIVDQKYIDAAIRQITNRIDNDYRVVF